MKPISFPFGFSASLFCGEKRVVFLRQLGKYREHHNNSKQTQVLWSAESVETISSVLNPKSLSGINDAINKVY